MERNSRTFRDIENQLTLTLLCTKLINKFSTTLIHSALYMISIFPYDVFISYSHHASDRKCVRQVLLPRLEKESVNVFIDFHDFHLGAPLVFEMTRAVEESKFTLAVLTPTYLKSKFAELETILAEHLGLENGQERLIAIMKEECKPRLGFRCRYWLDMTQENEFEENIQKLIHEIKS